MIRGIRGAITVEEDKESEVISATENVVLEMIDKNKIDPSKVASVFISVTNDINSVFPAKALRSIEGWKYVPVMCMKEIEVTSALPMCIRVMMHVNTQMEQQEVQHVYMEGATVLRPDLNS